MPEHGSDGLETVRVLARAAGLSLDEARLREIAPRYQAFQAFLDAARAVPLGETEPAMLAPVDWGDDA